MRTAAIAGLILAAAAAAEAPRERHFRLEFDVIVDKIPTLADYVNIWIPIPHSDANQEISRLNVESDHSHKTTVGQYGNKMLFFRISRAVPIVNQKMGPLQPPPRVRDSIMVSVQMDVKRREHLRITDGSNKETKEESDPNMARWLEPDRLVPLDDKIRGWAQEVVDKAGATSDLEKARAIYNHIVTTVSYDKTGQGWGRGDICYACDARRGNCTDFHAIFIGYARALGIPARFSIGLPIPPERGLGTIAGYHCWAEFYVKGMGWIPVDASEAAKDLNRREYFFGAHDENRVEFSRGRDLTLKPPQQGEPLNYSVYPYVEIDGRPFASVKAQYRFGDFGRR